MLDIKQIRENPEKIKKLIKTRNVDVDEKIDKIMEIDTKRRSLMSKSETMKAEQNALNREIPRMKKNEEDTTEIMKKMKNLSDTISDYNSSISKLKRDETEILLSIPNVPHESVPVGKDELENKEIRVVGTPRKFQFQPKAHWEIGKDLDILDVERAAKVTGTRFHFHKGLGARLERALINFYLDTHIKNGYTELFPPLMVNRESMTGTGQLPKFEKDAFKIENNDFFMIPTAEVPVTNMHRNEIIDAKELPIKYCAYSPCFRAEAGAAGRDTKGLIRQHQFNKVELVKFCKPEDSYSELEKLTNDAESVLKLLELPYRIVCLCTGDLGFSSAKTYDIEVWMPSYNRYVEISSCSNFESYQARRMSARYKNSPKDKAEVLHTLNGSGVAIGRTVAAILENFQNEDGTVTVPKVLQKFMGTDLIKK